MSVLGAFLDGRNTQTPIDAMYYFPNLIFRMALDILLRHRPSLLYTTVGRCFYTSDTAQTIANGAQLWQGFHQSIRPTQGKMMINLDVSATAFYESSPVLDIMAKILGRGGVSEYRQGLTEKDRARVEKALRGLKVVVTHRGNVRRKYRVSRVGSAPATRAIFGEDGEEQSVAAYFLDKYGIVLEYPNLPCLIIGDVSRNVMLPMEVCDVVIGQRHLRKLNERQVRFYNF
jgi:hypothetical protein